MCESAHVLRGLHPIGSQSIAIRPVFRAETRTIAHGATFALGISVRYDTRNHAATIEVPPSRPDRMASAPSAKRTWTKTDVNFWLDVGLAALFIMLGWVSTVVYYAFPPGPQADGWTLWGWTYQQWASLQFATLCLLAGAVVLHVMLHWTWVYSVAGSKFRTRRRGELPAERDEGVRTLWGVALLILVLNLIGLGVAAAVLTVKPPML